jgi:hypothetical protein
MDAEVSRANANIIWAGSGMTSTRSIYVSKDGGLTYQTSNNYAQATLGSITRLASHPTEANTAYALFSIAGSPKILRTTNLGETWEDISGFRTNNSTSNNGFPDVAVYCLYVRPDNPDIIWAGTEIGIVESLDAGNSWALIEDFPKVSVWDMKGQDDEIVIATHGRGIWTAKVEVDQSTTVINPKIIALGTSPKSDLVIKILLEETFDYTELFVNNVKAGQISSVLPGEYVLNVKNVPRGTLQAKLIGYKSGAPIHSATFTGQYLALNAYQKQYFNYFNTGNDFQLVNFTVQPFGNSNTSMKTMSNYPLNVTHVALLKQPIIVSNDYPFFIYRDVAIVEPGAAGTVFGQPAFKDYVVVEATKDGMNWTPISDGYDASFNNSWLTAFNANQPGNANIFVDHNIDLTNRFNVNDTLLFRFRLFSDNSVTAWGWAIDDLYIQQKPTGIDESKKMNASLQTFPNPSNGKFAVSYVLTQSTPVEIGIYNLSGGSVYNKTWGERNAGEYIEEISLAPVNGIYLLKLKTKQGLEVKKLMVAN